MIAAPIFPGYADATLVGQGGLGRVYRATRVSTGGVVAIKELPDVASASSAWHRARRELEALLRLKGHAGVVSVEEIFEGPGGPCIVMEFMPGGSLNDRLKAGGMSVPESVFVGQQVSQALRAAHEVGIVHRDVKPHNLMVNGFGHIKVCDFGISALTRTEGGRTQTHALTLAYASPEELDGSQTVGPAADVYSFAATMQHLMTGLKPSFQSRMGGEAPALIGSGDPVVANLAHALKLAMANHPADRPTMGQIAVAFESASTALGSRRLSRLPGAASVEDWTIKRTPEVDRPLISSAPAFRQPPEFEPVAAPTIARFNSLPTAIVAAPLLEQSTVPTQKRRRWWLIPAAVVGLLAAGIATAVAMKGGSSQSAIPPTTTVGPLLTEQKTVGTVAASPALPATAAAPITVLVATAAPIAPLVPPTTIVPATTSVPTTLPAPPQTVLVTVTVPVFITVLQVIPLTTPATNPPPPVVSVTQATQFLQVYYGLINNRQYQDAWALLSAAEQGTITDGFTHFTKFWDTIGSVTIRSITQVSAIPGGIRVSVDAFFTFVDAAKKPEVDRFTYDVVQFGNGYVINAQGKAVKLP
jgi:serine/threonine protein kinase